MTPWRDENMGILSTRSKYTECPKKRQKVKDCYVKIFVYLGTWRKKKTSKYINHLNRKINFLNMIFWTSCHGTLSNPILSLIVIFFIGWCKHVNRFSEKRKKCKVSLAAIRPRSAAISKPGPNMRKTYLYWIILKKRTFLWNEFIAHFEEQGKTARKLSNEEMIALV